MAYSLTKQFALLCEGDADRVFFEKLFATRKITDIDIPPHKDMGANQGRDMLGWALKALSGDPFGYKNLKGVLIFTDSADDPTKWFAHVCRKVASDGPFSAAAPFVAPLAPYEIARQPPDHPAIAVMPIPEGRDGGLETLCFEAITSRKPWLGGCVNAYLSCGQLDVMSWTAEKRDKARIQCAIAALFDKDPNKPLRHVLTAKPGVIDFRSRAFTPLVNRIKKFCAEV